MYVFKKNKQETRVHEVNSLYMMCRKKTEGLRVEGGGAMTQKL